jgi:hypothetical protein
MKCPKCGYASFPYLESCRKCGRGLAEQRTAFGPYALYPDPPDLLLAYQVMSADAARAMRTQPLSTPAIDLDQLNDIALQLAQAEGSPQNTPQGGDQAGAVVDQKPTQALESTPEEGLPPAELSAERASPQELVIPQSLDLSEVGDLTLELENTAERGIKSPESPQPPMESPAMKPVYDLDLDETLDDLPLGSTVRESRADDDDEETVEYTLEIDDDLELEIDELELEADEEDDAAEEDDDER